MFSATMTASGQLALAGELSLYTLPDATRQADAALAAFAGPRLTVNLAELQVAGSAALALLLHLRRAAAAKGADFAIASPPPPLAQVAAPVGLQPLLLEQSHGPAAD